MKGANLVSFFRDKSGYWYKSSYTPNEATCVEVACDGGGSVRIRDTKHRDGGSIAVSPDSWAAIMKLVRPGTE